MGLFQNRPFADRRRDMGRVQSSQNGAVAVVWHSERYWFDPGTCLLPAWLTPPSVGECEAIL